MKKPKEVRVYWRDIKTYTNVSFEDAKKAKFPISITRGLMVWKSKSKIIIQTNEDKEELSEVEQPTNNYIVVPFGCVVKIIELEAKRKIYPNPRREKNSLK